MKMTKITASFIVAGLLLGLYGLVTNPDADSASAQAAPAARVSTDVLEPIHGLAPIDEVIDLFARRSDDNPLDYLSRTQLGAALNAQAREQADLEGYESAEQVLNEALAINPRWQPAQLSLASALHSQHRFGEAQVIAQRIVDTDSGSLGALAMLGDASLERGDLRKARAVYEELIAAERSAPVVSRLARLHSIEGDLDLAVELATEALELSEILALRPSGQAFYWFQLGRMQFEAGDVDAAIDGYKQARNLDPGNAAATESLAFAQASIGDHETAASLYEELLATGAAPDLHGSYADSLRALGRIDEAAKQEDLGERLATETLDRFPAERRHLVSFFLERDPGTAVMLARADLQGRQDVGAYDTLAWALYHHGQFAEAATVLDQSPFDDAPFASMLYHQAAIRAAIGDADEAIRLATKALRLNTNFHPTEAAQAQALVVELSS